jgi:ABC-2 type transport system ATP-binding protein
MGLNDAMDKLVRNYSGGMIRKLEIAQSMLHNPKILFLDEPTVGLDPVAREMVWDHVRKLKTDLGMTIFLTTHYMEEADFLCNRVAIMNLGKIAAIGTPDDLKKTIGKENATLDEVFVYYAGSTLDTGGSYRDSSRTRRIAKRLG